MSGRAACALSLVLPLACSSSADLPGEAAETADEDQRFVPQGLLSHELEGEGGLTLVAFTLQQGASGLELLAAVKNDGNTPACEAGMLTHFIDRSEQLVASVGSSLHGGRLYRLDDGLGTIISCVAPGELAMAAATALPATVVLDQLDYLQHAFPAFTLSGIVPLDGGITLSAASEASAGAFKGTLENGLGVPVNDPKVAIFPVNRAGRPLGIATSSGEVELQPGDSWSFETTRVDALGVSHAAYASVSLPP